MSKIGSLAFAIISSISSNSALAEVVDIIPYGSKFNSASINGVKSDQKKAPFGSGGSCDLQSKVRSDWPTDTTLTVRKTFDIHPGDTNVTVYVVVDNDARVFINNSRAGEKAINHEGCPTEDENIIQVPAELLSIGQNTLKVVATDRGFESYLDIRVTVDRAPIK